MAVSKSVIAELMGSFLLVWLSIWLESAFNLGQLTRQSVGVAFGFATAALLFSGSTFNSSMHLNPAVTLSRVLLRDFPKAKAAGFIAAQLCGSAAAGLLAAVMVPQELQEAAESLAPAPGPNPLLSQIQVFLLEAFFGGLYVWSSFAMSADRRGLRPLTPIAAAATLSVAAGVAGPFSGGVVNPLRLIGPLAVDGKLCEAVPFVLASLFGGIFAAFYFDCCLMVQDLLPAELDCEKENSMRNAANVNLAATLKF